MTTLAFYKEPTPLQKEKHKNLKIELQDAYDFAKDVNSLPVAGVEFFQASRSHPIMFIKNSKDELVPLALLSLREKGHDIEDTWQDVYVPAFMRRYPFALSSDGAVIFDSQAPHMQEEKGDALFDDEGEPTETLKNIVGFLQAADSNYKLTEEYCKALLEHDLLKPFETTVKFKDAAVKLNELFCVDEKKFNDLPESEVYQWFKKGWLAWTHAHLHSISSLSELAKRHAKATAVSGDGASEEKAQA